MQKDEGLHEFIRRAYYELDRVEAVAEQHRRWHTHLDQRSAECFICTLAYLARCYLRVLSDYAGSPAEHQVDSGFVEESEPSA